MVRLGKRNATEHITRWLDHLQRTGGVSDNHELALSNGTTMGLVRKENQDRLINARFEGSKKHAPFLLFAIADGLGGMQDGGACASLGLAALTTALVISNAAANDSEVLKTALQEANAQVFSRFKGKGGTTLVLLLVTPRGVTGASVGDSRLYTLRAADLSQLSEDDSIGAELNRLRPDLHRKVDIGGISNHLTQFVGQEGEIDPHIYESPELGSLTILATDGIHRMPHTTLHDLVTTARTPGEAVHRLINVANWCGGRDNASAIALTKDSLVLREADAAAEADPFLTMWDAFGRFQIALEVAPLIPTSREVAAIRPLTGPDYIPKDEQRDARKRKRLRPLKNTWRNDEIRISFDTSTNDAESTSLNGPTKESTVSNPTQSDEPHTDRPASLERLQEKVSGSTTRNDSETVERGESERSRTADEGGRL